jgi:hypothetical protein
MAYMRSWMQSIVTKMRSSVRGVYTELAFVAAIVLQIFAYDLLGAKSCL